MSDARSYRSQPQSSIATPSSSVDASFVDPQNYDDYVAAARANALPPDSPLHPDALGRLSNLVSANPGINPDVAVAALTAGLDPNSDMVKYLQNMATQAKYEANMQAEADQRKKAEELSNQGTEGFLKATARTAFNVMDAPFQVIMNAVNDTIAEAVHPEGPTATFGDVLFNTDAAHQFASWGNNDPVKQAQGNFGSGWLPDPESSGAKYKYNEDVRLSNGMAPSLGGKFADALELQQGTHPYSIVSGLVDLGSRVLDPTMYIGAGEVKGLVNGGKAGAEAFAKTAATGSTVDSAAKALSEIEGRISNEFDMSRQINAKGAERSAENEQLRIAQNQWAEMSPEAQAAREEQRAHEETIDTLLPRYVDAASRQTLEEHRQSLLDLDAMAKQAEHEASASVANAANEAEYMGAQKAEMLANGHDLPRANVGKYPEAATDLPASELEGLAPEVRRNLDALTEQYRVQHEDSLTWIEKHLHNDRDRKLFHEQGLFPLREVAKAYGEQLQADSLFGQGARSIKDETEFINAILTHGIAREDDYRELGVSLARPYSEWDRISQFADPGAKYDAEETIYYRRKDRTDPEGKKYIQDGNGKDKVYQRKKGDNRQRYVRIPWAKTKADWEEIAFQHQSDLEEQALQAAQKAHADTIESVPKVDVHPATESAPEAVDAVRTGVLSSAEKLGEEFNLPEDTVASLMGVTGKTTGEVIDNVKNVLTESGLPQIEVEKFMYTLNDELMQHGAVVDGHPDLAPAGRGRDIAATHQAEQDALDAILHIADAHGERLNELAGLSEEVKQYIKDLNEAPINQANRESMRLGAKADRLDRNKVVRDMREVEKRRARRDAADAEIDRLTAARDESEAATHVMIEQALKAAGKEYDGEYSSGVQMLRDLVGLRTTVNGVDSVTLDKGVRFLLGTKAEPLYRAIAAIDDQVAIRDLTRGKLTVDMCKDLAAAKTVDEVRAVIVRNIGTGMINKTTGQLLALRIAGRSALGGREADSLLEPYSQAFGFSGKAVRYGSQVGKRNVPWSHARDVSDHEGMVDLISDTANYMDRLWRHPSEDAQAFHNEWVRKMMDAVTPEARRTLWYRFLDETVARAGRAQKLDEDMITDLQDRLKVFKSKQEQLTSYLADARAATPAGEELVLAGQVLPKDIAMLEAEMSNRVMSPDWQQMRRALKDAQSIKRAAEGDPKASAVVSKLIDGVFDDYWRTSVLAFRGGYVARNTFDLGVRMTLAGQPSMFTSPWGILAMALGHKLNPNSGFGRLLKAAERADFDVTGARYEKIENEDILLSEAVDGFNRVQSRNTSLIDPGSPSRANRIGIVDVDADSAHFHRGWANELSMLHASPIANEVFKVLIGKPSTPIKQWLKQTKILNQRDAAVDYFWNGPGRATLDKFFDASSSMRDLIKSPEELKAYMFGGDAVSLEQRWKRLTLDLNPTIVDHVSSGGFRDAIPDAVDVRGGKDFTARRKASEDLLKSVASVKDVKAADFPIKKVRAPIWVNKAEQNAWTVKMRNLTDSFFHVAYVAEREVGMLPEFKYAKWENAADLAAAMHPEDAARLLEVAKKTLGGGNYFSWASQTLRRLEKNVARADGTMDIDTVKRITDQHAVDMVKNMFYDAQKRNAFGHATRLISPFAQAWANSLKTWGRLAAENPQQVYKVASLYEAGMGKNTSMFDNPSNPDNALFYQDPKTGQAMVGIPLAGDLLALAGSITSMGHGGQPIDPSMLNVNSPVSSFNLLFQNGLLPSVGPAISIPASSLDSTQQYNAMIPDWLKKTLVPYVNVNPDTQPGVLESALPGWLGNILAGIGIAGFEDRNQKYLKPAMGTLFSKDPSRYLNANGLMDQDGQSRLVMDAQALAFGLSFGKGILQNMSAGSIMPDLYAKDKNGNNLSQLVLAKEYSDLERTSGGNRSYALATLADKYGMDILMTMLPNREFGYTPTTQAYQFVTSHPDIADKNSAVLSLFLPGGGYSALLDRYNRERIKNPALDAPAMVQRSNDLLHQAQLGQLQIKLTEGKITGEQFDAQTKMLNKQYKLVPQPSQNSNNIDLAVNQLRIGLQSPELANTEAGRAIAVYMELRDAAVAQSSGENLSGQGDAELRAWLFEQGKILVGKYREFATAWRTVFLREVEE